MIGDLPYGLGMAHWDQKWNKDDINALVAGFMAATTPKVYTIALFVDWSQLGTVKKVFERYGLRDVMPYVWYKENHNKLGGLHFLSACEYMIIGHYPNAVECTYVADPNPVERHNFLSSPPLRTLHKYPTGDVVNPCEKPPAVWKRVVSAYCPVGGQVLDVCAGAGGDLRACIELGINTVAVELDPVQFKYLVGMLDTWDQDRVTEKKKKEAAQEKKDKKAEAEAEAELEAEDCTCQACGNIKSTLEDLAVCPVCEKQVCIEDCLKDPKEEMCAGCLHKKKQQPAEE